MGYYEVVVSYGGGCEDIICFKYKGYLNDSNDIVTQAIELGFIGEEDRHKIKSAKSIPKYEYQKALKSYLPSLNHRTTIQPRCFGVSKILIAFFNSPSFEGLFVMPQNPQLFIYFQCTCLANYILYFFQKHLIFI